MRIALGCEEPGCEPNWKELCESDSRFYLFATNEWEYVPAALFLHEKVPGCVIYRSLGKEGFARIEVGEETLQELSQVKGEFMEGNSLLAIAKRSRPREDAAHWVKLYVAGEDVGAQLGWIKAKKAALVQAKMERLAEIDKEIQRINDKFRAPPPPETTEQEALAELVKYYGKFDPAKGKPEGGVLSALFLEKEALAQKSGVSLLREAYP